MLVVPAVHAQVVGELPRVVVSADRLGTEDGSVISAAVVAGDELAARRSATSDSAQLLGGIPGISLYSAGGVSSLPAIDGLHDDRVRILVDGMTLTASCPNHMNPSLSYLDPGAVASVSVIAGITPVSLGGDSIGGTIAIRSTDPVFASGGGGTLASGELSIFSRSNGNAVGGDARGSLASEHFYFGYTFTSAQASDYTDGNGQVVRSTEFKAQNNRVGVAARFDSQLLTVDAGWQSIPYQGFPNQYMDMTRNSGLSLDARYRGDFGWGGLEAHIYRQRVRHSMDALADKAELGVLTMGTPYTMPVDTEGVDSGELVQATIRLSARDTLRLGQEYHGYAYDDWWPPIPGSMMNGPDALWDIRDGRRDRLAVFGEWEARWSPRWSSQLGARAERVTMDTGPVQGYFSTGESMFGMGLADGSVYQSDANAFNAQDHRRVDHNVDATVAIRFDPNANSSYGWGVGQKTRSPNLYERYAWSNAAGMAGTMISWFGDLNAYAGNLNLKPEVAHLLRADADWHDPQRQAWQVTLAPFYTRVDDFITVEPNANLTWPAPAGRVALRFANHAAELYGADLSAHKALGHLAGEWSLRAIASYVRGRDLDTESNLYNMMPANARIALEHRLSGWSSGAELQIVAAKRAVDPVRQELPTAGYAVANVRTSYSWQALTVQAGLDNLFDTRFDLPLGGVDFYEYNNLAAVTGGHLAAVPGMGRSVNVEVTARF